MFVMNLFGYLFMLGFLINLQYSWQFFHEVNFLTLFLKLSQVDVVAMHVRFLFLLKSMLHRIQVCNKSLEKDFNNFSIYIFWKP
jgi:hypothetical protein